MAKRGRKRNGYHRTTKSPYKYPKLTEREVDYLALISLGLHNKEIAKVLFVSFHTVKKTVETICRKLSAINRTQAVAIAFIHQILNIPSLIRAVNKYIINLFCFA